jgi:long-chain acyl-CoA synthetase
VSKPIRYLIDAVFRNARTIGTRRALLLLPGSPGAARSAWVTWRELAGWASKLADRMEPIRTANLPLVHRVENTFEDVLVALACQLLGIVEVPIDSAGGEAYVRACRDGVGGDWLDQETKRKLVEDAFERRDEPTATAVSRQPPESVDDDALILFTSGTLGDPKGVVLSHRSLLLNAQAKLNALPQSQSDCRLTVLSIAHGYARTCDLGTWVLSGCSLAITCGFEGWVEHSEKVSPTHCNMVPSLAERVSAENTVPQTLQFLGCGGAAMLPDRFEHWVDRGVTVIQGYGLTEAGPVISSQTPQDSMIGHAGRFVDGWQHRVEQGRLFVRGRHLMTGYWRDRESTARRIDADGWLDTGDLVRICESTGQLEILGRSDDRIILSNGHAVDPLVIEKRIMSISGIRTAVVSQHSDRRTVELWIETDSSPFRQVELDKVLQTLPSWARPRTITPFRVPEMERETVFNRKGAIRRTKMLVFLRKNNRS